MFRSVLIALACTALTSTAVAAEYFVDAAAGEDAKSGRTELAAWKTLTKVAAQSLVPGDVVRFRCGGVWDAAPLGNLGLNVRRSGTSSAPITFTAYGSGAKPKIVNSTTAGMPYVRAITISASYVVIDGLSLADAFEVGIAVQDAGEHDVVRNCEVTNTGNGVSLATAHNLVEASWFHDLHMIVNSPGAPGTAQADDDYGAVGVVVMASDNEISHNRIERCRAESADYGMDGGGVEFYGTMQDIRVHHNWIAESEGFFEIGSQGGSLSNVVIHHNVAVDNHGLCAIHNGAGTFGTAISGVRFEHNTVVERGADHVSGLVWFEAAPSTETFSFRNNVVAVWNADRVFERDGFTHDHDLYFTNPSSTPLGITLGATESIADPEFVSAEVADFHVSAGSPAIDHGADLGYGSDFDDAAMPVGSAPDLGAYEYRPPQNTAGAAGLSDTGSSGRPGGAVVPTGGTRGCGCSTRGVPWAASPWIASLLGLGLLTRRQTIARAAPRRSTALGSATSARRSRRRQRASSGRRAPPMRTQVQSLELGTR